MNRDYEKNLLTVRSLDGQWVLGNAFIAGHHVVSVSHLVGEKSCVYFGNEQRFIEFRIRGDETRGQDLSISRGLVGIEGFPVAKGGLEIGEEGKVVGYHDAGLFEIPIRRENRGIRGPRSPIEICNEELVMKRGMSGSVLLNSYEEAIGPLVWATEDGKNGVVEHISR